MIEHLNLGIHDMVSGMHFSGYCSTMNKLHG